jgi:hypothetical protein
MHSATDNEDKDEAEMLLPWYVAGRLEGTETHLIEKLACQDKEFAKLIEEARHEAQAIAAAPGKDSSPPAALWARIEKSLEKEEKEQSRQRLAQRTASIKDTISNFFAGLTTPQWQGIAAVAIAVCVLEGGAIGYLAEGSAPAKFQAASGPKTAAAARHSAFIVSFRDAATIAEIGKALSEAGAVVVEGPNADMLYRLGLSDDTVEAKNRAYTKLQSSGLTKLILPEK